MSTVHFNLFAPTNQSSIYFTVLFTMSFSDASLLALFLIFSQNYSTFGCRPVLRIYESRGYGEDYIENAVELVTIKDVRDIADHGLDHFRMYTCPEGV